MVKPPKISKNLEKKHRGQVAISLENGKVVAFGKTSMAALKKAKKIIPNIEDKEFVISRIHHTYLAA